MPRDPANFSQDPIDRVVVGLGTTEDPGADTDGEVYLLLAGREFNLKRPDINDRERGANDDYVLGRGANIENKAKNNPRDVPIFLVWGHPVGLRFEPVNALDEWNIADCGVQVFTQGGFEDFYYLDAGTGDLWLGRNSGLVLYFEEFIQGEDKDEPPRQRQQRGGYSTVSP
jgi:hypothetical protein